MAKDYVDMTVSCVEDECGHAEFVITAGEQKFFDKKGFPYPKRCKPCREKKKNRANSPFRKVADDMGINP